MRIGAVRLLLRSLTSPDRYEERINCLITVLLALFAFLSFARTSLPDVPISTWLDMQIFKSVMMCMVGMLESLLCKYEFAGRDLAEHHLDGDYNQIPAQWSLASSEWGALSSSTAASRIIRVLLFAVLVGLMVHTAAQIYRSTYRYSQRLAKNRRVTQSETKKRSTDFEPSAWGWADQLSDKDAARQSQTQKV